MTADRDQLEEATLRVLDELPRERVAEVLDFALFVKQRETKKGDTERNLIVPAVPASQLDALVGLVAWGGDALNDTEHLYDGDG
jgi:hypothetical protein